MNTSARLINALNEAPVVASVKNDEGLDTALDSDCGVIFFLYGTICNIGTLIERVKEAGKMAFVHLDLTEGLGNRDVVVDFIHQNTRADGNQHSPQPHPPRP
jgi:glycerol uptake operon antiterminator